MCALPLCHILGFISTQARAISVKNEEPDYDTITDVDVVGRKKNPVSHLHIIEAGNWANRRTEVKGQFCCD